MEYQKFVCGEIIEILPPEDRGLFMKQINGDVLQDASHALITSLILNCILQYVLTISGITKICKQYTIIKKTRFIFKCDYPDLQTFKKKRHL